MLPVLGLAALAGVVYGIVTVAAGELLDKLVAVPELPAAPAEMPVTCGCGMALNGPEVVYRRSHRRPRMPVVARRLEPPQEEEQVYEPPEPSLWELVCSTTPADYTPAEETRLHDAY